MLEGLLTKSSNFLTYFKNIPYRNGRTTMHARSTVSAAEMNCESTPLNIGLSLRLNTRGINPTSIGGMNSTPVSVMYHVVVQ